MDKNELLGFYQKMLYLRLFDDLARSLKMQDIVWSGYHPYTGQEAVSAGAISQLRQDDCLVGNHRSHGHAVAKGTSAKAMLTEMMGRQTGVSGGLGGAMQFIHAGNNVFCGSIVGSGIPIAAGMALAMKQKGTGNIAMCLFGDGASNTGAFHEGLNLAAIWKLPVVYILENNQYAEAMPVREFVACSPLSKRARAYDLEEITVDGNDVEAVYMETRKAIEKARKGGGPTLIEAFTYRTVGHYIGDPEQTYRTKEEVAEWKKKCPVLQCKNRLLSMGATEEELEKIKTDIKTELKEVKEWSLEQPFASFEQAVDHVWIPL
ncbi:MAG: thiamine pyrophosphate-dependent dehydrogenase E1 component subunit alpha [Bacteroidales bacterium]|nr:thiamine pyrophosphate-dependent dehydrogenase E1 component subunit alpha [Bacteroidales bacterium]